MATHTKAEAKQRLTGDWDGRPESLVGVAIIDFLAEHLDSSYLPLSMFFEIARPVVAQDKNVVINVVNYLTGGALPLLNLELEYIDDDRIHRLETEEARAATQQGINPLSGDFDPDLAEKLFVCYSISESGKAVLGDIHG